MAQARSAAATTISNAWHRPFAGGKRAPNQLVHALRGIRRASLLDLPELLRIEEAAFAGDRLNAASFRRLIRSTSAYVFVCEAKDRCAGYAVLLRRANSAQMRLYSLAVHPSSRENGFGGLLLSAAEQIARSSRAVSIRLEVRTDNGRAIALYRSRRYRAVARLANYYEDGADAYRLMKPLAA